MANKVVNANHASVLIWTDAFLFVFLSRGDRKDGKKIIDGK